MPVRVAQRPDAWNIGPQLLVDLDVAAIVGRDTGLVEPEIGGVRDPADREQQM